MPRGRRALRGPGVPLRGVLGARSVGGVVPESIAFVDVGIVFVAVGTAFVGVDLVVVRRGRPVRVRRVLRRLGGVRGDGVARGGVGLLVRAGVVGREAVQVGEDGVRGGAAAGQGVGVEG